MRHTAIFIPFPCMFDSFNLHGYILYISISMDVVSKYSTNFCVIVNSGYQKEEVPF